MKNLKSLLVLTLFATAFTFIGCSDDDDCGITCQSGFVLSADCNCIEINPCVGITCPEGEVLNEDCDCISGTETVVAPNQIIENTTWTANKIYELASKVVVDNGATLTIEPGTIIKGRTGTGSQATALIVARGSKINACGTADAPIIFTSVLDNIKLGEKSGTNLDEFDNEKWGGVIILGNAPVSTGDGDTEGQIEGIPADETYGKYGGNDVADNSGSLCYVSIRHGGALIGDGNEINGLTLGGVGNGTTINNVEVVANLDDGIELFGGTVDLTNVIVAYQDDDAIDIDQNYSGTITNFFIIHGGDGTDEALEIDGPEGSTYTSGLFNLINGTIVSTGGKASGADLKSKAQGQIKGVNWQGYSSLLKYRASFDPTNCDDKSDAYSNAINGSMIVMSCQIVGNYNADQLARVYSDTGEGEEACFETRDAELQSAIMDNILMMDNSIVTSASNGANLTELRNWSWTDIKGLLQ
jgi:hypothetical protein